MAQAIMHLFSLVLENNADEFEGTSKELVLHIFERKKYWFKYRSDR